MNSETCPSIRELLVEHSDRELSPTSEAAVESHLRDCPDCRCELDRLRESLALAQTIWHESTVGEAVVALPPRTTRRRGSRVLVRAVIATAIVCAGILSAGWFSLRHPSETGHPKTIASSTPPVGESPTFADDQSWESIRQQIERQARSARLAASAEMLADRPSLKNYRHLADEYLARAYGDLEEGKRAAARLQRSHSRMDDCEFGNGNQQ